MKVTGGSKALADDDARRGRRVVSIAAFMLALYFFAMGYAAAFSLIGLAFFAFGLVLLTTSAAAYLSVWVAKPWWLYLAAVAVVIVLEYWLFSPFL